MRKPNYRQAKNQREAAKVKAQQEKLAKRQGSKAPKAPSSDDGPTNPTAA